MKPKVAIDFTDVEGGDGIVRLEFNDTEQIDELICTLFEMRQDLEEQIEREKQRRCEKRKRRNKRVKSYDSAPFSKFDEMLSDSLFKVAKDAYDSMDENTKSNLKPIMDLADKIYKERKTSR